MPPKRYDDTVRAYIEKKVDGKVELIIYRGKTIIIRRIYKDEKSALKSWKRMN